MHSTPDPQSRPLSHVAGAGADARAVMVDVGAKPVTERRACARATVLFPPGVLDVVVAGQGPKGPVVEVARFAGIQAAKRTAEWIPMCHVLPLEHVEIQFERSAPERWTIHCSAACTGKTGVEMEALVGATAAALTVIDMTKALSPLIAIERVELIEKSGGKSGPWSRSGPA